MKKLSLIAAALVVATSGAFAATATDDFTVTVNFTGSCSVKSGNAASNLTFAYTAFGAAQSQSTTTVFECSRGLTPTFTFDNTGANQSSNGAQALDTAITGEGVIAGIRYTMAATPTRSATGTAASAASGGTAGSDGTADEYTVAVDVDIAGGQAGSGTTGSGTQTRVLTITY